MQLDPTFPIVSNSDDLDAIAARAAAAGAPQLPLLLAAAEGKIALVSLHAADALWPAQILAAVRRPTVVLIGDDPGQPERALGPTAWRCAPRIRYWCRAVMAHGAGGDPDHYREAVRATELVGRVALIETDSLMARPWAEFLRCPRTLLVIPPNDGAHPVVLSRGATQ